MSLTCHFSPWNAGHAFPGFHEDESVLEAQPKFKSSLELTFLPFPLLLSHLPSALPQEVRVCPSVQG
jgi:hypothetical protein